MRQQEGWHVASRFSRRAISGVGAILILLELDILTELRADDNPCDPNSYRFSISRFQALEKKYSDSIILVNCGGEISQVQNIGTGFLVDSRVGLFLTAYHVIKKEGAYDCTRSDSRIIAYPMGDMCKQTELKYVAGESDLDIALLQVSTNLSLSK